MLCVRSRTPCCKIVATVPLRAVPPLLHKSPCSTLVVTFIRLSSNFYPQSCATRLFTLYLFLSSWASALALIIVGAKTMARAPNVLFKRYVGLLFHEKNYRAQVRKKCMTLEKSASPIWPPCLPWSPIGTLIIMG